jgi:hypothetical protein
MQNNERYGTDFECHCSGDESGASGAGSIKKGTVALNRNMFIFSLD